MLVLLFVCLWFILRGDLFYVLPCVILFLCFSVLLALRLPRLGKRELILVLFIRLLDLRLFGFICFLFLFLLVSGKGCALWMWHSLDFSLNFLNSNSPTVWEKLKLDGGYGNHFGFPIGIILDIFHLHTSTYCVIVSFNLIHRVVWEKCKKKTNKKNNRFSR